MSLQQEIMSRLGYLQARRGTWENGWQQISDDLFGSRWFNTVMQTPGELRMDRIYDTSAIVSRDRLASGMQAIVFGEHWFNIRSQYPALMENQEVAYWFYDVQNIMHAEILRPQANFEPQVGEMLREYCGWGTGAFYEEEHPSGDGVIFASLPLAETYIAENQFGIVDTWYRHFRMTARNIAAKFGQNASTEAVDAIESGKPDEEIWVCHAIQPRRDRFPKRWDAKNKPFVSAHVTTTSGELIKESGYDEPPCMTPRWSKEPDEWYGRGPGHQALSDQRMVHAMDRTTLRAAEKAVDPPLIVSDDGVLGNIDTSPGGLIMTRGTSLRSEPVQPFLTGNNFPVTLEMTNQKREQIKRAFLYELFPLFEQQYMTATQTIEISQRTQELLGPTAKRLQSEFHRPLITRTYGILMRQKKLPPMPQVLKDYPGFEIEYVSPAARSQNASQARSIMVSMQTGLDMSAEQPQIADNYDFDFGVREVNRLMGAPDALMRDLMQVQKIRKAREDAAAQQAQLEQAAQVAQAAGQAAPALKVLQGEAG